MTTTKIRRVSLCFAPSQILIIVEISWNFDTVVRKNILIFHETFSNSCGFAVIQDLIFFLRIWSPLVVLYCRKHFYSILTNLSNLSHSKSSIVPFASSDLSWKTFSQNTFQQCGRSLMFFKIVLLINFLIFKR